MKQFLSVALKSYFSSTERKGMIYGQQMHVYAHEKHFVSFHIFLRLAAAVWIGEIKDFSENFVTERT